MCIDGISYVKDFSAGSCYTDYFVPKIERKAQRGTENCQRSHSKVMARLEEENVFLNFHFTEFSVVLFLQMNIRK